MSKTRNRDQRRFEALSARADAEGVPWRDLVSEGFKVPGDLVIGGITIRYDWRWRADELAMRLGLLNDPTAG